MGLDGYTIMDDYLAKSELSEYAHPPMFSLKSLDDANGKTWLGADMSMPIMDSKEHVLKYLADIYGKIEDGDLSVVNLNETREPYYGSQHITLNIEFIKHKKDMI